jgi:hypothetical protein
MLAVLADARPCKIAAIRRAATTAARPDGRLLKEGKRGPAPDSVVPREASGPGRVLTGRPLLRAQQTPRPAAAASLLPGGRSARRWGG